MLKPAPRPAPPVARGPEAAPRPEPAAARPATTALPPYLLTQARRAVPPAVVPIRRDLTAEPAAPEVAPPAPATAPPRDQPAETPPAAPPPAETMPAAEPAEAAAPAAEPGTPPQPATAPPAEAAPAAAPGPARPEPPEPELPPVPIPRLGGIRMPAIPAPPQSAVRRSAEILARTGSTPEVHHALVAQAVLRVTEAARVAQRDIVWRVGNLALNTRMSIEDMALEVPRLVGGAIGVVRAAVRETLAAVRASAGAQISNIEANSGRIVSDFAATRTQVMGDIRSHLRDGSAALKAADDKLQAAFSSHLPRAGAAVAAIPESGMLTTIPLPPRRGAGGGTGGAPAAPAAAVRPGNLEEAAEDIRSALHATAGKHALRIWQDLKCADAVPAMVAARKAAMLEAARTRAQEIGGEANRGELARLSFGLIAPTAAALDTDAEGDTDRAGDTAGEQQGRVRTAAELAAGTLRAKLAGVERALDWTRPKTTPFQIEQGLHEAGRRIQKALRQQARAAEAALRGSAAALAEAYPDMVRRLEPLLPPGQLLDAGERVPRLARARDSVARVNAGQLAAADGRATEATRAARAVLLAQGRSLAGMAEGGAGTIRDMLIPAAFDFELVGALYVDPLNAGARLVTDRVVGYAERVAEALMRPMTEADNGVSAVERAAVEFLNGSIRAEHAGFLRSVAALGPELERPEAPFPTIRDQVYGDLSKRSDALDKALRASSLGEAATAGATGLAFGPGGMVAGVGVYLWLTDSDDEAATAIIGELPWPGPPALEHVFAEKTRGPLRERIGRASLTEGQRQRLENLLDSDAATRAGERARIAEQSTAIFTGPSRETREKVLRGMGAEERAAMSPAQLEALQASLRGSLRGTELEIAIGYTAGRPDRVLAARMQERLDAAHDRADDDTVQAMDQIEALARIELGGSFGAAWVQPSEVRALTDAMYPAFERLTAAPGTAAATRDPDAPPSPTEMARARQHFIAYATRPRTYYLPGGMEGGQSEAITVPAAERVQAVVRTVVEHGAGSREAWAARAGYEVARAEAEARDAWTGSLSEETQNRVTRHTENPVLAGARREVGRLEAALQDAPPGRREALRQRLEAARRAQTEAEAEHGTRMDALARALDPTADLSQPGAGIRLVSRRVGAVFARGNEEDRRYGTELVEQGRASLSAGVRLAVRGLGTNEELLGMVTANRSKHEIKEANEDYQRRHGETMREAIEDDVSGDLALQMELAREGEPENDQDRLRLSAMRHRQERVTGTGFLAAATMQDTWQREELDRRRDELGGQVLEAALAEARRRGDGEAVARLSALPHGEVFDQEGRVAPGVAGLAFDEDGNLRGDAARIAFASAGVRLGAAADSYRAEIDRQEAMMTSFITAAAIALSVVLLVVPGVNLVAAGVLTALIAGTATIAVKAGMRGGRYGWEEMATDAAMTGIEMATAGIGGAMAGSLGKAGMAGRLAAAGARLEGTLGRAGSIVAREAIVAAASQAAQTAIQDETWSRGIEHGLLRVTGGALRGAAMGGMTAAVSAGVQNRLGIALGNAEKAGAVQRLGRALGPSGRNILSEAVSQSLGAMSGEAAGIVAGRALGQPHGTLREELAQIGRAGLRDLATGGARAGIMSANRTRYQAKLAEARATPDPGAEQLRALRLAAISAGEQVGGREASYDLDMAALRREVAVGRTALAGLPPALARHLVGADEATLLAANRLLASGEAGAPAARAGFLALLEGAIPGLDSAALARDLEAAQAVVRAAGPEAPGLDSAGRARQRAARGVLVSELEGPVRGALRDLPLDGLASLPDAALRRAAAMVARGTLDPVEVQALLRAARSADPGLDEAAFTRNLVAAVETGRVAMETRRADLARRRDALLAAAPEAARPALAALPDTAMERLSRQLERGGAGSAQQRAALLALVPAGQRVVLGAALDAMAGAAAARVEAAGLARRAARMAWLGDLPEALRAPLSALPDHALLALQAAHAGGEPVPPARRARLVADALREAPGADGAALGRAIEAMLALPRPDGGAAARLRAHLLAAVPPAERHLVADAPLLVMEDAAFAAFTRSRRGDAVTLIIDGRPVVVMRRGADPRVLQEEGLHVLQARQPETARRAGQLDERSLADWDSLPLDRQMGLYRDKLALEVDAQERLLASLDARMAAAPPELAAALARQRLVAVESLANLRRRQAEVSGVSALQEARIAAGLAARPDWLDQPARLFGKRGPRGPPETATLGAGFHPGDTETEAALRRQMASLRRIGGDADAHAQAVHRLAATLGDPDLAAAAVRRLGTLPPAELAARLATLHDLASLPAREGHAAIRFALETRSGARLQVAAQLLDAINIAALTDPALRQAALALIESSRRDVQGSSVPMAATLDKLRAALAGRAALPVADPVLTRVLLDAMNLTAASAMDTHLGAVRDLLRLRGDPAVGEATVGNLLRASGEMPDRVRGQFLQKVAALAGQVATAGDPTLVAAFRHYVRLAASPETIEPIGGGRRDAERKVAPDDLRASLQTMGGRGVLTAVERQALLGIETLGQRGIDVRLDLARQRYIELAADPRAGRPAERADHALAEELVRIFREAGHPGGPAEAMLLAQTYRSAIDFLVPRMASDPDYDMPDRAALLRALVRANPGLTGAPLFDAMRRALRQHQIDFVLDQPSIREQLQVLRGMEGAEEGMLATDRWGKGKLFELYVWMRAGGDYVSVFGRPGDFRHQAQQARFNTIDGFGPSDSQTVYLSGDPSRSGDGVLHYEGHAEAPAALQAGRDYLVDTKAGGGAFKEDQFARYLAEQLRNPPPVSMTTAGHAGLIYLADSPANAADAQRRAREHVQRLLDDPNFLVGSPPRRLTPADLPHLRIFFATYGPDGKLHFEPADWPAVAP